MTAVKSAFKAAILRMIQNIQDEKTLRMIYKYVVYLYTGRR